MPEAASPKTSYFVAGGTLSAEASSYVEREADSRLFDALSGGKFCYVLNSRQMGKSSLCVRTMRRLEAGGVRTAFVDLTKIGGRNVTPEQWYAGIAVEIGRALDLRAEVLDYWKENGHLSPVQRLFGAVREVALSRTERPLAIFFDEIDATRSLPFSADEFFAAIRECYNRRVQDETYSRLTFCLLGVAVPNDLINNPTSTPFNVGERIYLRDFTLEEASALAEGFSRQPLATSRQPLLARVFYWTNGHPYLTQSLCSAIAADDRIQTPADVDALVTRDLFEPKARETNINLADVANRALHAGDLEEEPEKFRADLLSAYEKAWKGKALADDESNRVAALLKLSGMMRSEANELKVRNRIYERVFDRAWIRENMPGQELQRQRRAFYLGVLRTTGIAMVVVGLIGWLAWKNSRLARAADLARGRAEYEAYVADVNQMKTAYDSNDLMLLQRLLGATSGSPHRNIEWDFWNSRLHDTPLEIDYPLGLGSSSFSSDGNALGIQEFGSNSAAIYSIPGMVRLAKIAGISADETLFSAGGRWVVLNSGDNKSYRVRDAVTSAHLYDISVKDGALDGTSFSPLGHSIVARCHRRGDPNDQDLIVCDARTGKPLHRFHSEDRINSAAVSDDGQIIAFVAVNAKRTAVLDDYYGSRTAVVLDFRNEKAPLAAVPTLGFESDLALSPDGSCLAFGNSTGRLVLWDVRKHRFLVDRQMAPTNSAPTFSADGHRLLVVSTNLVAWLIDVPSGKVILRAKGAFRAVISPSGRLFAVSGAGTRIYSGTNPELTRRANTPNSWSDLRGINSANRLVVTSGHAVRQYDPDTLKTASAIVRTEVAAPTVSRDGNWYLKTLADGTGVVVGTVDGSPLCHIPVANNSSYSFDVTRDRSKVAVLDIAGAVAYVFDNQGHRLWEHTSAESAGNTCCWSPSGDCLAVGLDNGNILILDSLSGLVLKTLAGPRQVVVELAFSPDGRYLATASSDVDVYIFSVHGNEPAVVAHGHSLVQRSVCFAPDGLRVLTASDDGTVRAWDARTGRQVLQIGDGTVMQYSTFIDSTGTRLYTSDYAGGIFEYPLHRGGLATR